MRAPFSTSFTLIPDLNKQTCTIIVLCVFALCLQKTFCDATSDIISALKRQESENEFLKARVAQLEENADSGKELHDQERKHLENQLTAQQGTCTCILVSVCSLLLNIRRKKQTSFS
ncbi:hypothetical protein DPMN_013933 [Dreissena polymorpha]|uniref:Uncharacterized protein n=1 Tax=Dreissena polymorpha TaxID=45954 RepID=A0A9D4N532_DREPO|nr:hypothetical protein DPMN_013933 [Dreissena polymorpha]